MHRYGLTFASVLAGLMVLAQPSSLLAADEAATADEEILKLNRVTPDNAGILAFLRMRTLKDVDRQGMEALIVQLGSKVYKEREAASRRLVALGEPALPFLRQAVNDPDAEVNSRAIKCIKEIEQGPGPGLPAAAIRTLTRLCKPGPGQPAIEEAERSRRTSEALSVLLAYFPFADDEYVESEIFNALGTLGIRPGKIDPILEAALKDPMPQRRAAVVFSLARSGDLDQRATVRQFLADADAKVRTYAARGLLADRFMRPTADDIASDEKIVKEAGLETDAAGLLGFLRKRTLTDKDREKLEELVRQLGAQKYKEREEASKCLVQAGTPALPFLRPALNDGDVERARRAKMCIDQIDRGPGSALPAAAVRLLVQRQPQESVSTLVNFIPFADDEAVEEEVLTALGMLSTREPKLDPALTAALKDPLPQRRAAAAYVIGLVGQREQAELVRPLLQETSFDIRYRAAKGLLAAKDKAAVSVLAALLMDAPKDVVWQVESLLQRVAGDGGPTALLNEGTPEDRQKVRDAWLTWWRDNQDKVNLAQLDQGRRLIGHTIVAELDTNKVWEYGADGKVLWEINNLQGPIDAWALPNGRILIAEHNGMQVTMRDTKGAVKWTKQTLNQNPVACQPLPNGNTFIATYNSVMEVNREGKEIYNFNPNANGKGFPIYGAHKTRNGHILCSGGQGTVIEMDTNGKLLKSVQVASNGGWLSVVGLPNGRYLVALTNQNKVVEVDSNGKTHWECSVMSPAHAERLPNGRTLIACMNHRLVVEVDAAGKEVAKKAVTGRPFHSHRR